MLTNSSSTSSWYSKYDPCSAAFSLILRLISAHMVGRWLYSFRACLYRTNTSFMCLESTKMGPFCIVRVDDSIPLWHDMLHHFAEFHDRTSANEARPPVWQCVLNEAYSCSPCSLQRDSQDECRHQAKSSLSLSCHVDTVARNLQSGARVPPCLPRTSGYLCFQSCAWSGMRGVVA